MVNRHKAALAALAAGGALVVSACGGSSSGGSAAPKSSSSSSSTSNISYTSFTTDFSVMKQLSSVAAAGKGKVGVLLPDTVTSARYVEFDAPYLTKAFETAGIASSDLTVQNAHGDNATQVSQAQADITNGATVLVLDPLTSGVGAQIEKYAKQHGVAVVDYDRITLGGQRSYYVSFNNVTVGKLIGTGFADCLTAWKVSKPTLIEMRGDPTDNNATQFAQGYDSVIAQHSDWTVAAKPAGTWDPPTALTEFTQALTAHSTVNSAIIPNDNNAAPIASYLQKHGVKAKTFPLTGQDATSTGLQNILLGWQCGSVYKPIQIEAQAAAAVALYVRAGQTPPSALVNATTKDTQTGTDVPSVLLVPIWVTTKNMESTVIHDGAVKASQVCTGSVAAACTAAGIS